MPFWRIFTREDHDEADAAVERRLGRSLSYDEKLELRKFRRECNAGMRDEEGLDVSLWDRLLGRK